MRTSSLVAASVIILVFGCSDATTLTGPEAELVPDARVALSATAAVPALVASGTTPVPDPADRILLDTRTSLQHATSLSSAKAAFGKKVSASGSWGFTSNIDGHGTNALRVAWPRRYSDECKYASAILGVPLATPHAARMYVQWKQHLGRTETGGGVGRVGEFTMADRCNGVARAEMTALRAGVGDAQRLEYRWMAPSPLSVRLSAFLDPAVHVDALPGSTFRPAEHVGTTVTQTLYLQAESAHGARDGVVRLWVDGTLVIDRTGVAIGSAGFRRITFPGQMAIAMRPQTEYFWDVVAWEPATAPEEPPPNPVPVAAVTVTPASATLSIGSSLQLVATLRDASGAVLTGRTVTWQSLNTAVASVSAAGLVTGASAGTARIRATSESVADTAVVTVTSPPPPPPPDGIVDPTLLPIATSQRPAAGTYGRNLAAGQTYIDPNSGVTVLKLTSASVPTSNGGMYHGYSEGGPNISQPWTGTDGETYCTVKVGGWLVDIRYSTFTPVNWRRVSYDGEIGLAFSMNPATPRIAFVVNGKRIDRYNTATNSIENIGNWPWNIAATGTSPQWLQTQMNDSWIVAMLQSTTTIVAFRPSDGFQRAVTPAQANVLIDEPHLDREFPVVYIAGDAPIKNKMVNLETGAFRTPNDPDGIGQDSHGAPLRGKLVAQGHWQANAIVATDINGRVWPAISPTPTDVNGDYHLAGQWVFNNPSEYFVADQWKSTGNNAIYKGMIGLVSINGDVRLLAAHDAIGTSYAGGQPHPTLAPDGKFVMWTTNMNGSSRYDTFIARVPVR